MAKLHAITKFLHELKIRGILEIAVEEKKGISRRQAVKAVFALGAGLAGAGLTYERKGVVGFLRGVLSNPPEQLSSTVEEIQNYISVSKEGLMKNKVDVNTGAFATALCLVAIKEDPEKGLSKLRDFLWKYHLEIQIKENEQHYDDPKAMPGIVSARYSALSTGGPALEFRPSFLTYYELNQESGDVASVKNSDKYIIHEMEHLYQDVRDPGHEFGESIKYAAKMGLGTYDYSKDPEEIEAREKSDKLVDESVAGISTLNDLPWPYGKFFSFH